MVQSDGRRISGGILTLVRIFTERRLAVERDLMTFGYCTEDVGHRLSIWKLLAIVIAGPPNSAIYHAETRSGAMTPEAQMLAQMSRPPAREPQPKAKTLGGVKDYAGVKLDAMPADELMKMLETKRAEARERASTDRVIADRYTAAG